MPRRAPRRLAPLMLLLVLVALLLPRSASASRPVIVPGREDEILALLDPHELGDELSPGWTLHSFAVDASTIELWIAGPDQKSYARVLLDHPEYGPEQARRIEGFALTVADQPPGSEAAVAELVATVERNDDGSFWGQDVVYAHQTGERSRSPLLAWGKDGLVLIGLFTIVLLLLVAHELRGAEPWMKWSLLAIVVLGAGLRLLLSPEAPLGVWSYSRFLRPAQLIYEGPGLALVHPGRVWMTDLILDSTLFFALLAPLAVFVHARYLLGDHRAALIAAGVVAILPLHLRFSHTDVAFIPSITVGSVVFALVHGATRESKAWMGWLAVALVGAPLVLVYSVRPLNIMYFPLLLGTALVNQGIDGDKAPLNRWRGAAVLLVLSAATALGAAWLLRGYTDKISEGLSFDTLLSALQVMLSPRRNMLLNPVFTPPGLTALALLGAVDLWRRRRRRLLAFLLLWLLGFLAAHAYFVPLSNYMQARYHLHLIVPFVLLAACGFEAALRWLARERSQRSWLAGRRDQAVIAGLVAYLLASPLIHWHAVRHVDFNEVHEWRFVHSLRETIPAECTIIEYVGVGEAPRFERVGSYVEDGAMHSRWTVVPLRLPATDAVLDPSAAFAHVEISEELQAVIDDPPECLYWYEGLDCVGFKPPSELTAPACDTMVGRLRLEEQASISFDSHIYDESLGLGLGETESIELRLHRARARTGDAN